MLGYGKMILSMVKESLPGLMEKIIRENMFMAIEKVREGMNTRVEQFMKVSSKKTKSMVKEF